MQATAAKRPAVPPHVVVVDDEPLVCETLVSSLAPLECRVSVAHSGGTAMDIVRDTLPSVVLLDIHLGATSGLDVMKEVQRTSPGTECIIMTAHGTQETAIEAVNSGAFAYLVKPFTDSTLCLMGRRAIDRKETREALRRSEQGFRQVFDTCPDAILLVDAKTHQFVDVNQAAERLYGYTRDEFCDLDHSAITAEPERTVESFEKTLAGKLSRIPLRHHRRRDGTVFPVEISASVFTLEGQQVLCGIVHDISARIHAEEELRKHRQQLSHAERVLQTSHIVSSLAHEINQPLLGVLSNAQAALRMLAAKQVDHGELRAALSDIVSDSQRAGDVIQRIRSFLRKDKPVRSPLDINSQIRAVLDFVRAEIEDARVRVRTALGEGTPLVMGDPIELQQVILNIVLNAEQAMSVTPEASRELTISTCVERGTHVKVIVEDTGPGIADPDRIFEPFVTTKKKGLGLGLSIGQVLVHAHGGTIWAENRAGGGARVCFTVPVAMPESE